MKFKHAQFIVQEDEIRYALFPLPIHSVLYETPAFGTRPLWLNTYPQFNMIRGDRQIVAGLSTVYLPSPSPN